MAYRIRYTPAFRESLDDALAYLDASDSTGRASRRLLRELKEVRGYLGMFPKMYAVREAESKEVGCDVRAARVGSHILYYVAVEGVDEVILYALRHQLADVDGVVWPVLGEK